MLVFISFAGFGQAKFVLSDKPFSHSLPLDKVLFEQAEKQAISYKLSKEEKEFLYLTNYLRKHPAIFSKQCITPFLKLFPEVNGPEANSLQEDLLAISSLPTLKINGILNEVAAEHASDLSLNTDGISHIGTDGRDFSRRISFSNYKKCASENIYTGKNDPLLSLIMLLLDIGYGSKGHRKNLLSPNFNEMGISIKEHRSKERVLLVQEFGCG
jgi:hypothetical protein